MDISHTTSILLLSVILCSSVYCEPDCTNVVCPTQLDCRYPKVKVELPDPNNRGCCNITECICEGTNSRLSSSHDLNEQYRTLVTRFTNCTMIDGNLEIVYIQPKSKNSTFDVTKHIRTVTGYVLIVLNTVRYIDLSSLRLIRGEKLYVEHPTTKQTCGQVGPEPDDLQYALFISGNQKPDDRTMGLKAIHMPHLTEIRRGHVKIQENRDLCFVDSIIWEDEILNTPDQNATVHKTESAACGACSASCVTDGVDSNPHCWGDNENLCQEFTRIPCKDQCSQRCTQPLSETNPIRKCCETYCAAGCTASGDCYACEAFNNFGECVRSCPNGADQSSIGDVVANVDKDKIRYALFLFCVKECPSTRRVLEAGKKCVLTCPIDYYAENGHCKECPDGRCSNICYGLEAQLGPMKYDEVIHSGNIGNFTKNCTIIEGSLSFRMASFEGDSHCKIDAIKDQSAFDVFKNVEEITGFLSIEHWPYKNLCIFSNLKRIRGVAKREDAYSLLIMTHAKNLKELCFNSLEEIESGLVVVQSNKRLCHVDTVNWDIMFKRPGQYEKNGRNSRRCLPCDENCDTKDGCWGKASDQCVTCQNFTDYTDSSGKFADLWVIDQASGKAVPGHNVTNCVSSCDATKGVYATQDSKCFPCDIQCNKTCDGPGPTSCTSSVPGGHGCRNVLYDGGCVESCPISHFPDGNQECQPCSSGCVDGGCDGPDDSYGIEGCTTCYKTFDEDSALMIFQGPKCQVCVEKLKESLCASGCTYNNKTHAYACYAQPPILLYVLFPVLGVLCILIVVIVLIWWRCRRKVTIMRKHIQLKMMGDGLQPDQLDTTAAPSGTAPNCAKLRIVKEDELALGKELGSGAFGAVYKAVWTSMHIEGERIKIPVAVKQLKTLSHNSEIMDEAYVMASVDNPHLIRLLGICMTEQVSLITQLMPLGSLLEYVRGNTESIGSRQMLSWCMQIAKGMQYLEEKHLVHRDLAARNVLVKTPHHVKITDFGLSKMLNATQSVYFAEGGKLPIKWLAVECITERKFSHQSDVWAFGVTCWEIFTFGARPYDGVPAVEVLSLLERGERLIQPSVCTIEVYMLLIKCWLVDPLSRPRFTELVTEFTQMSQDHARYLVLKNDLSPGILSPNPEDERRFFERLIREDNVDVDGELLVDDPDDFLLTYGNVNQPEYENQPALDRQQSANGGISGGTSRDTRLFSRNTPSAQIVTPTAHITSDPLAEEVARSHPRVSDSSSPDDVFANSGQSLRNSSSQMKSMTVDLPTPEKGAEARPVRFRPAQSVNRRSPGRKDSEENSRYTEDPTTTHNRSSYIDPSSTPSTVDHEVLFASDQQPDDMVYDEEEYLLPTPHQAKSNDYIDPLEPNPSNPGVQRIKSKTGEGEDGFRSSLSNTAYIGSDEMPPSHPSSWPNQFVPMGQSPEEAQYINTPQEHEYLNWNGNKTDAMMSDVVQDDDAQRQPLLEKPYSASSPDTARSGEVTFCNNEKYMTADSGIGDDNHSVLSTSNGVNHPRDVKRRQNSFLSSGGSSSNGSLDPLAGGSPVHRVQSGSGSEHERARMKPVPKQRSQNKKLQENDPLNAGLIGLDNPEYMMLQESVSDSKALLNEETTDL